MCCWAISGPDTFGFEDFACIEGGCGRLLAWDFAGEATEFDESLGAGDGGVPEACVDCLSGPSEARADLASLPTASLLLAGGFNTDAEPTAGPTDFGSG